MQDPATARYYVVPVDICYMLPDWLCIEIMLEVSTLGTNFLKYVRGQFGY